MRIFAAIPCESSHDDRRGARERLDEGALRRFELAHPSPPPERAREVDGGEVAIDRDELDGKKGAKRLGEELGDRLTQALADDPGGEVIVRIAVRVSASNRDG